ncbi:10 kDa heat shock protein, putative, partial [Leishmania donovani]
MRACCLACCQAEKRVEKRPTRYAGHGTRTLLLSSGRKRGTDEGRQGKDVRTWSEGNRYVVAQKTNEKTTARPSKGEGAAWAGHSLLILSLVSCPTTPCPPSSV